MNGQYTPVCYSREMVFAAGHLATMVGRHVQDGSIEAHSHDFMELAVIGGGRGVHVSIEGEQPIRLGDVFVVRPGVWHAYRDCSQLEVYNCCFGLELLQHELAWVRQDALLSYLFWSGPLTLGRHGILSAHLPDTVLSGCLAHLDELHRAGQGNPAHTRAQMIGHLILLFDMLATSIVQDDREGACAPSIHPTVLEGMRLLEGNLAFPWSLTELARRLHVAPAYLVRLFKGSTGLSPMAYLARIRAECAAALLLHTDTPVFQIGEAVGWPDPNYFARRFRASFGVNATTYRTRFSLGMAEHSKAGRTTNHGLVS